jgi:exonuclease VII small subunit
MLRPIPIALGLALMLSISERTAHAQYAGWGGWGGWGGWSATPGGDYARGLGYFNAGAGIYNLDTAQARSINTDTFIRWNQYLYEANQEATRMYAAKRDGDAAKNKAAYNEMLKNLRENPGARDVENGDALNAALDQLSDPRISSSSLKIATSPVDAQIIRDIPFRSASEAVTIVLSQVKAATKWPSALNNDNFADDKKAFEEIVDKLRAEDEEGDISAESLTRANNLVSRLRAKIEATRFDNVAARQEASKFVKTLAGLVRMLEKPDTREAFDQLRMVKTSSLGNLVAFMHVYNLRFGAATTPRQRMIYDQLYPLLDEVRDRIVKESNVDDTATARAEPAHVGDFFNKMDMDSLQGKPRKDAPPQPNNP